MHRFTLLLISSIGGITLSAISVIAAEPNQIGRAHV